MPALRAQARAASREAEVGAMISAETIEQVAFAGCCRCPECRRHYNRSAWLAGAALLAAFLTEDEIRSYVTDEGRIKVTTPGGRSYRVGGGTVGVLDGPMQGASLCVVAYDDDGFEYPIPDTVLAKKLLLETDERRFLGIARGGVPEYRAAVLEALDREETAGAQPKRRWWRGHGRR